MKLLGLIVLVLYVFPHPSSAQWKNVAPNLLVKDNPRLHLHGALGAMTYSKGKIWLGYTNGLWRSADDGVTWQKVTTPVPTRDLIADVDFYDEYNGLICTGGMLAKQYDYFLTRDGGVTWTKLPPVSIALPLQSKFVGDPNRILLTDIDANMMLSTDGGVSFRTILKKDSVDQTHCVLTRNANIYALQLLDFNRARIYSTTNDGISWQVSQGAFGADCYTFALDSCDEDLIYITNENYHATSAGRLIYSHDGGDSFTETETRSKNYYSGAILCTQGGVVYAQTRTGDGILRSTNRGLSWKAIGGPPGIVDSRMLCAKDDNTLFAVDSFGSVWATYNSGGDSLQLPFGGAVIADVRAVSESQAKVKPLDTFHVHVRFSFPAGAGVEKITPDSVTYTLRFKTETIDFGMTDLVSSIVAASGWNVERAVIGPDSLLVTLRNDAGIPLVADMDLGTVIFKVLAIPKALSTTITINAVHVFASCRPYRVLLSPESNFVRTVAITPSSVEEYYSDEDISLYPNPARSVLMIESAVHVEDATFLILNDLGEQVLERQVDLRPFEAVPIDLTGLASGVYYIHIRTQDRLLTKRVTITH